MSEDAHNSIVNHIICGCDNCETQRRRKFPTVTHTSTYAVLDVSRATFMDIQLRLSRAGVLSDYFREYERPLIIFGTVALAEER